MPESRTIRLQILTPLCDGRADLPRRGRYRAYRLCRPIRKAGDNPPQHDSKVTQ